MNQFMVLLFSLSIWSCQGNQMNNTANNNSSTTQAVPTSVANINPEQEAVSSPKAASSETQEVDGLEVTQAEEAPMPSAASPEAESENKGEESPAPQSQEEEEEEEEEAIKTSPTPSSAAVPVVEEATAVKEELPVTTTPDHSAWDALLQQFVSASGKVNYSGFNANKAKLNAYLEDLAQHPPQSGWSRQEAMAYWINAYNAFTIQLILENYPVQSIRDIAGGQPWDKKWIQLGGKTYSLNQIENDILRPQYQDARIHFAVNCAAKSCPPLHNRAFTSANLNSTLERLTRQFINNTNFNTIKANRVEISKIFDWYGGDFGDLRTYLNRYAATDIQDGTEINFKEYDWALNN